MALLRVWRRPCECWPEPVPPSGDPGPGLAGNIRPGPGSHCPCRSDRAPWHACPSADETDDDDRSGFADRRPPDAVVGGGRCCVDHDRADRGPPRMDTRLARRAGRGLGVAGGHGRHRRGAGRPRTREPGRVAAGSGGGVHQPAVGRVGGRRAGRSRSPVRRRGVAVALGRVAGIRFVRVPRRGVPDRTVAVSALALGRLVPHTRRGVAERGRGVRPGDGRRRRGRQPVRLGCRRRSAADTGPCGWTAPDRWCRWCGGVAGRAVSSLARG